MKLALAVAIGLVVAVSTAGAALAGKVNMPKEGSYEFDFCPIGHGRTLSDPRQDLRHSLRSRRHRADHPAGPPFDRMGARCYGLYTNLNGKQAETRRVRADRSGRRQVVDGLSRQPRRCRWHVHRRRGTGKYDGMTVRASIASTMPGAARPRTCFPGLQSEQGYLQAEVTRPSFAFSDGRILSRCRLVRAARIAPSGSVRALRRWQDKPRSPRSARRACSGSWRGSACSRVSTKTAAAL